MRFLTNMFNWGRGLMQSFMGWMLFLSLSLTSHTHTMALLFLHHWDCRRAKGTVSLCFALALRRQYPQN